MAVEKLLLLSGAIGAGKTSVANTLIESLAFRKIGSSDYLISQIPPGELKDGDGRRLQLQELGDHLDRETDYRWIIDPVAIHAIASTPDVTHWLVDAVRKKRQIEHFRNQFGPKVRHIHLTAPDHVLRTRYTSRGNYDQAIAHPNEVNARSLVEIADQIFDTSAIEPGVIATRILTEWKG